MSEAIRFDKVSYRYKGGQQLSFPDLTISKGETCLVIGESGVGKTTCLHLMAGLMKSDAGDVVINGTRINGLSQSAMDHFRGQNIGVIFQQNHFISSLNVIDNVLMSQYLGGVKRDEAFGLELLKRLGMSHKATKKTNALSQGERQRVSIARALAARPSIILADEPTSALDDSNTTEVFRLLKDQADFLGSSLVIVTHDTRLKDLIPHQIELKKA
ncbi:MAG: ATP-binding cassette domain-containing protein [Saprospiraceae bacterium]|nr:ATP-binding cassette domain-containing protein [Saprospiraceae bacterium]